MNNKISPSNSTAAAHPYYNFMLQAVELAKLGFSKCAPNPRVGAVLVKDGYVVAEGWHKAYGEEHAEVMAIHDAQNKGINPADCTLVVTLEPCNHTGKTPPCTEAILAAGITRVVIGISDPNTLATGGAEFLAEHGILVEKGIAEQECRDSLSDFIHWQSTSLPYTILKLACTLDGRIATRTGHARWISGTGTRKKVHELRQHMQAIVVGGNTFYADNPGLTCRLEEFDPSFSTFRPEEQPLAVVVTSRLPAADAPYALLQQRPEKTIFWTTSASAASPKAEALRQIGVRVLGLPSKSRVNNSPSDKHTMRAELDLALGLSNLREEHSCYHVMCEGGGRLGLSLLEAGLAQELHLHMGPKILGDNEAIPLFSGMSPETMNDSLNMRIEEAELSGSDVMLKLRPLRQTGQSETDAPA